MVATLRQNRFALEPIFCTVWTTRCCCTASSITHDNSTSSMTTWLFHRLKPKSKGLNQLLHYAIAITHKLLPHDKLTPTHFSCQLKQNWTWTQILFFYTDAILQTPGTHEFQEHKLPTNCYSACQPKASNKRIKMF